MSCREILSDLFSLGSLLSPVLSKSSPQIISRYKLAPCGHLLVDNIKTEWLRSVVLKREEPVFVFSQMEHFGECSVSDLQEMFTRTKQLSNNKLPFIVANVVRESSDHPMESNPETSCSVIESEECRHYFSPSECTSLCASLFVKPSGGQQMFYHWQSQRKYWWRKFASHPGKISVSEDAPNKTVTIQIELTGGGQQAIETITNHGTSFLDPLTAHERESFEMKDGRKKISPYLIESRMSLETAALVFLAESSSEREGRKVLRLHRKLAPYKVAFPNHTDEELTALNQYLYESLRASHIYCLFSPIDPGLKGASSLEQQLAVNDRLGVPYSILVRDSTLQDGLVGVRSRDTTLEEKVHISRVNEYVQNLLKNY